MVRILFSIIFAGVFVFGSAVDAGAADWPQWRGPNRDGISQETGLLKSWPSGGPKLLWTATGVGIGFSTPSVVGNLLLTMGNIDDQEFVIALDTAAEGTTVWKSPIGPVRHKGSGYPGPRSTPTVDGDQVYAVGLNGDLVCLERATGKIIWRKDFVGEFGGGAPSWGYCESVLIDGDWVVCTPGGEKASIVALEKATGEEVWRSPIGAEVGYASIIRAELAGVKQYVQFMSPALFGVAAKDGAPLWSYAPPANDTANISTPLAWGDDMVFASSGYGTGGGAARIEPRGTQFIAVEKFFTGDMTNHHGGMVVVEGHLYGSSDPGVLTCLDLATGETKWRERAPSKCSIVYVSGQLVTRSERGKVCLVNVSPAGCEIVGEFEEPSRSDKPAWPHPVVANGRLYLRDQDALACFDLRPSN